MAKLNRVCFKINVFGIDREWKRKLFEEIREYVCEHYPEDVYVIDIDSAPSKVTTATIVMRTTKVIRQEIVDRFGMEYRGSRDKGWIV